MPTNLDRDFYRLLMRVPAACAWLLLVSAMAKAGEGSPQQVIIPEPLSLNWVLLQVRSNNPALKAARANWQALRARIPQARAWEDTRFGVDVERSDTTRFDRFADNEWMFGQTLPVSGRNRQRARAADAEAAAGWAEMRRRELDLLARARIAFFSYASAYARLELNRQYEVLWNQLVTLAREREPSGTGAATEPLLAEIEVARVLKGRTEIERQLNDEKSQLNVLIHRSTLEELPPPPPSRFRPLLASRYRAPRTPHDQDETQFTLDWPLFEERMRALAATNRPEIVTAKYKIEAARAYHAVARRAWIPDPEIRIEARQFRGDSRTFREYDTGLFFSFPLFNRGKYRAAAEESRKNLEAAQLDRESVADETDGLVRRQVKKIESAQTHYEFVRERMLPLAQQSEQAARADYKNGKTGFFELATSRHNLEEAESMLEQHLADYLSAIAELEALVGTVIEF